MQTCGCERHRMNILFIHNNFPAQFGNMARELANRPGYRVVAVGAETARSLPSVDLRRYRMPYFDVSQTHPFARRFDVECRRATQVLYALSDLRVSGFEPDLIVGHCGWGETLPLRALFPSARIAIYCEFYYRPEGQDVHFDPEGPQLGLDGLVTLHCKNASTLLSLADADIGLSPTHWQKETYPSEYQDKIHVVHEGVDGDRLRPDEAARLTLPDGTTLHRGQFGRRPTSQRNQRGFHPLFPSVVRGKVECFQQPKVLPCLLLLLWGSISRNPFFRFTASMMSAGLHCVVVSPGINSSIILLSCPRA